MSKDNSVCFVEFQEALDFVHLDEQERFQVAEAAFQIFCTELSKKNKSKPGYSTLVIRDPVLARQFKKTERRAVRISRQISAIHEDLSIFRDKMEEVNDSHNLRLLRADIKYRCEELKNCRDKLRLDHEFMNSVSHDTLMSDETSSSSSEF